MQGQRVRKTDGQRLDQIGPELKITITDVRKQKKLASGLVSSGGATLISMMQSTDLRNCDDPASSGRLHAARLRAVFLQCQMGPAAMVIINEQFEMPVQTALVEYDHMIEALAANGADKPFDISTLPWRSRDRQHLSDAHRIYLGHKVLSKDAITVPQQILW